MSSVANREWRWAWRDVEVVGVRDVVSGLFARALVWGLGGWRGPERYDVVYWYLIQ